MPLFVRGIPLVLALFRVWRRLPPKYRRRALVAAGRHGPRVASSLARRRRLRP